MRVALSRVVQTDIWTKLIAILFRTVLSLQRLPPVDYDKTPAKAISVRTDNFVRAIIFAPTPKSTLDKNTPKVRPVRTDKSLYTQAVV